jgi:hypothetical protein
MSKSSSSGPGDVSIESSVKDHAHRVDIRGLKMLPLVEFWQLFALMGILTGIGLMTIKYVSLPIIVYQNKTDFSKVISETTQPHYGGTTTIPRPKASS